MIKRDFLIVGQGIAGSLLSYELLRHGYEVLVIDEDVDTTSTKRAAGLFNPITGRKMVKTWLADELFPNLERYYSDLENDLKSKFLHSKTIYRPFLNVEDQNDWEGKLGDVAYGDYIKCLHRKSLGIKGVLDQYGGVELNYSGYVDTRRLVDAIKAFLLEKKAYSKELLAYQQLEIDSERILYRGYRFKTVIFCDGPRVAENPYWNFLPFKPVKGEILRIKAELPGDLIINRGVFVVPRDSGFLVGSTYDHEDLTYNSTADGIKNLQDRLSKLYIGEYELLDAWAGVRPATFDRKPFLGSHSEFKNIAIFNGFGTKGVSLVPYFAGQMVNYLSHGSKIPMDASVSRVSK